MEKSDAVEQARRKAEELNIPWAAERVHAFRRRIWPFAGVWNVVCEAPMKDATATTHFLVFERSGQVTVGGTVFLSQRSYADQKASARRHAMGALRFVVEIIACGALLGYLARAIAGQSILPAVLIGLGGALPAAVAFRALIGRR